MKRGFFFLRDCDFPAHDQCTICGKGFCHEHMRIQSGKNAPVCVDCLGKQMQQAKDKSSYNDEYYDSTWCYGYRHSYYSSGSYLPWYLGNNHHNQAAFDGYDVRSFDSNPGDDGDSSDDLDAEANVFDS